MQYNNTLLWLTCNEHSIINIHESHARFSLILHVMHNTNNTENEIYFIPVPIEHDWEDTEKDVHISLAVGTVDRSDVDLSTSRSDIVVKLKGTNN